MGEHTITSNSLPKSGALPWSETQGVLRPRKVIGRIPLSTRSSSVGSDPKRDPARQVHSQNRKGLSTRLGHPARCKGGRGGGLPSKPERFFQPGGKVNKTSLITEKAETPAARAPRVLPRTPVAHSLSPSPPPRREGFPGVAGPLVRARRGSTVRNSKGRRIRVDEGEIL